jgi:hypothetical protein
MPLDTQKERIGLIGGNGKFPILFAKIAKQKDNLEIIAVAIKGDASRLLNKVVDKIFWIMPGELSKMLSYFKNEKIDRVVMAGQVDPDILFDQKVSLDEEMKNLLNRLKDRKADTIFNAIADKLKQSGVNLIDPTPYLTSLMPERGTITKSLPSEAEWQDITFGRDIAKAMGHLDIGQTVVVKGKAVLAIEAMEGTDRTILRGGKIARSGAVIVKMSKPNQDMRFDVPVVGLNTIRFLIKSRARCLAIEANKTLLLDRQQCIRLANKKNICIVAI